MATTRNQLSYGSLGSDVTELQKLLNQNGYTLDEDGIYGTNTQEAVKDYQQKNNLSANGIADSNTWNTLTGASSNNTAANAGFKYDAYQPSDAVTQAQALLQQQTANKPGAYNSAWQGQLTDTISQILNRDKFSYDLNADALYQQYANQYMNQGKMAMMDTMGQAAAMTGGYGNSYAQSVGQQAYQSHLQQLNDIMPDLYQLALNKYQMEGDALYDQYAMLGAQEEQDYGRYRDEMSDWQAQLDRLQNQYNTEREYDYSKWADSRDFAYGQYSDDRAYDYQAGRDKVADEQWQKAFDYQIDRDQVADEQWQNAFDYQAGRDQVADKQWQNAFDYQTDRDKISDEQWQTAFDYQTDRDKISDEQWQKEYEEAIRQFNITNGIETPSASEGTSGGSGSGGSGGSDGGSGGSANGSWLNSDGSVNVNQINTNTEWWREYAASNGLDPNTGKKVNDGGKEDSGGGGGEGFTGSTYNEAAAYLKANGQSAAGLMTQSVWQSHKNNNNSADFEHDASSYKEYLAAYIYWKTGK